MITFVDTNILLDVLLPDPTYGERSADALEMAFNDGSLIINEIIYAELAPQFDSRESMEDILVKLGIRKVGIDSEVAFSAGSTWKIYRQSGGQRDRILADFLIGANAWVEADRLLTRDRGFYKKYFENLTIFSP